MIKQNPTINIAKLQIMTTTQLKRWYQEFKQFINDDNLPDFIVKLFDDHKSSNSATITPPTKNGEKFIFNMRKSLIMIYGENAKTIAFHEFTHIYDDCTLLQECDIRTRVRLTKLYSEYHAMQVQMMCACRFTNINEKKILSPCDIVYDNITSRSVTDYLSYITNDYKATIEDRTSQSDINCFDILLHTIYYISSITFFKNYCMFDISLYIDENFCNNLCGAELIALIAQYQQTDLSLSSFEKINELDLLVAHNIYKNASK